VADVAQYEIETIERGKSFILARSIDHTPVRLIQIYEIDWSWMQRHFPSAEDRTGDIQNYHFVSDLEVPIGEMMYRKRSSSIRSQPIICTDFHAILPIRSTDQESEL